MAIRMGRLRNLPRYVAWETDDRMGLRAGPRNLLDVSGG